MKPLADRLTPSQRGALLVLRERGRVVTSNRNRGGCIAYGSARVLVRHGLAAWDGLTLTSCDTRVKITDVGRKLANGIAAENARRT